ncbi:MAG: exopolyphosphatase [Pseudomonadota bacterium]
MRIVTRPDFDGIVCAVLINEAETIDSPVMWVEPGQVQAGEADIRKGDIMANLPYDPRCSVWFDHHVSNRIHTPVEGAFAIAPSAARVAYDYYIARSRLHRNFDELVRETDTIDAALLDMDQVLHPENYPYILLSMTVKNHDASDPPYWNHLVALLKEKTIDAVHKDPEVMERCRVVRQENTDYVDILRNTTRIHGNISVADFRSMGDTPSGNRFLTYSLFPESTASVKIRFADTNRDTVIVSIGHSIFNRGCNVNVGKLLSRYGGGGHAGAGGCSLDARTADETIQEILEILKKNRPV